MNKDHYATKFCTPVSVLHQLS